MASKSFCLGLLLFIWTIFLSGCANTFDAPLKPSPGIFLTNYTIPLMTSFEGQSTQDLVCKTTKNYYFFLPYPLMVDLAWSDQLANNAFMHESKLYDIHYADLEVFTVLSLFGCYKVNYYGKPQDESSR